MLDTMEANAGSVFPANRSSFAMAKRSLAFGCAHDSSLTLLMWSFHGKYCRLPFIGEVRIEISVSNRNFRFFFFFSFVFSKDFFFLSDSNRKFRFESNLCVEEYSLYRCAVCACLLCASESHVFFFLFFSSDAKFHLGDGLRGANSAAEGCPVAGSKKGNKC